MLLITKDEHDAPSAHRRVIEPVFQVDLMSIDQPINGTVKT